MTGHRALADIGRVVEGVRRAVDLLRQVYPGRPLTVVSALAEGADRIVAEEVLRTPGARLVAALPLPPDRYARDFGPPGSPSRARFQALLQQASEVHVMPPTAVRDEAYARAGEDVLDRCDVLLAVWDGQPAQGRGGTGEVVWRAREMGKPLLVVRAGNHLPGTDAPTSLGAEQGRLLVERLPARG